MQRNHMCKGPEIRMGLMCLRSRQKGLCGWTLKGRDGCSEDHRDLGRRENLIPSGIVCLACASGLSLGLPWRGSGWEKVASLCP